MPSAAFLSAACSAGVFVLTACLAGGVVSAILSNTSLPFRVTYISAFVQPESRTDVSVKKFNLTGSPAALVPYETRVSFVKFAVRRVKFKFGSNFALNPSGAK